MQMRLRILVQTKSLFMNVACDKLLLDYDLVLLSCNLDTEALVQPRFIQFLAYIMVMVLLKLFYHKMLVLDLNQQVQEHFYQAFSGFRL